MSKPKTLNKIVQKINEENEKQILEKIQKCQKEITDFRGKCDKDILEIEKKYIKVVGPYMKDRNRHISTVPNFWSKTLIHHPLLSTVFEPGEKDVFRYLTNFDIEDEEDNPDYFKVHFYFDANPYFENQVLTKQFTEEGSASTTIKWKPEKEFPKKGKHEVWEYDELGLEQKGFFRWFLDPEEQYCDPIADILRSHIWFDPLEFYFEDYTWESKKESPKSSKLLVKQPTEGS